MLFFVTANRRKYSNSLANTYDTYAEKERSRSCTGSLKNKETSGLNAKEFQVKEVRKSPIKNVNTS